MGDGKVVFTLEVQFVDWDGHKFGTVSTEFFIKDFAQVKPILSLSIHPLRFANDGEEIRNTLQKRGRKFVEIAGVQYKSYVGIASLAYGEYKLPMPELVGTHISSCPNI